MPAWIAAVLWTCLGVIACIALAILVGILAIAARYTVDAIRGKQPQRYADLHIAEPLPKSMAEQVSRTRKAS